MWYFNNCADGIPYGGASGDVPVTGDWNRGGMSKIGIYRSGMRYLNNYADGTVSYVPYGGSAGEIPIIGDWKAH
jgi:hypothetical protein